MATTPETPLPSDDDNADVWEAPDGSLAHLGPDGADDPETEWDHYGEPVPLPPVSATEYFLLLPGEEIQFVPELPKRRRLGKAVAVRLGELVLCGRHRTICRTPLGSSSTDGPPVATRLVTVFIKQRSKPPRTHPHRYLIATNQQLDLLGWLDDSDGWELDTRLLTAMVEAVGMERTTERYATDMEFDAAHPTWVG